MRCWRATTPARASAGIATATCSIAWSAFRSAHRRRCAFAAAQQPGFAEPSSRSRRGPEADLQCIKQARSVGAEWALVNEQAAHNRLTPTYVASMHQWLRQQLQTASSALTSPDTAYAQEIRALLAQPDDAAPEEL